MSHTRKRERSSGENWMELMSWGSDTPQTVAWTQEPFSELCFDALHRGPPYKTGGSFSIYRNRYNRGRSAHASLEGSAGRTAVGVFTDSYFGVRPTGGSVPSLPNILSDIEAQGAVGWNKFKPGKPKVDLGQFVGELHQIPTLPLLTTSLRNYASGKRKELITFKDAGGEYLNIKFGWVPFVKTLQDMHKLSKSLHKNLAQLKRDNGRGVRRGGTIKTVNTSQTTNSESYTLYPVLTNEFYGESKGNRSVTVSSEAKYWFAARFKYHIPDIGTDQWTNRATRALYGLNPTPSLLYELTPWSWLIDWFTNIGDVIDNMSENSAENLVADYAYIMASLRDVTSVTESRLMNDGFRYSVTSEHVSEQKHRLRASPYGFGLTPGDLSGSQMAILAALGASRSGW